MRKEAKLFAAALVSGLMMACAVVALPGINSQGVIVCEAATRGFTVTDGVLTEYWGQGGDVVIPSDVVTIGAGVFQQKDTITSVVIPDSVTTIGENAFYKCSLKKVVMGKKVASIGKNAFAQTPIEEVTIPASVTSIGSTSFDRCASLEKVTFENGKSRQLVIGEGAFSQCTALTSITLPTDLREIGNDAFYRVGATSITLPSGLQIIGESAFDSSSLTSIVIPDSVVSMGDSAFMSSKLQKVTIGSGIATIQGSAFRNCASLTDVTFKNGLKTINSEAFYGDRAIDRIKFPSTLEQIDDTAFFACSIYEVSIPESVTKIGKNNFTAGPVDSDSSMKPTIYGVFNSYADMYAGRNGYVFKPNKLNGTSGKTTWVFDLYEHKFAVSGTGAMADYEYSTRTPWTKYRSDIHLVSIGNGVTTVGTNTFYGCENLTKVIGCVDVVDIGINTFRNCVNLESVAGCTKLKQVQQYAFCGSTNLATIGTTAGTVNLPACEKIGGYGFYECCGIKILRTSDAMTYIGTRAFSNATSLNAAAIGANCATLGSYSFCGCTSLVTMYGCAGVTGIGQSAFNLDAKLTTVQGLTKLTSVGHRAFQNCTALKTIGATAGAINLDSVIGIGEYAFSGCKAIVKFTAGANLKQIETYAFQNNTAMTSLYLKTSKLATVGDNALKGIKANCVIYVPSAKVASYKSGVLKGKGQAATVTIKAY